MRWSGGEPAARTACGDPRASSLALLRGAPTGPEAVAQVPDPRADVPELRHLVLTRQKGFERLLRVPERFIGSRQVVEDSPPFLGPRLRRREALEEFLDRRLWRSLGQKAHAQETRASHPIGEIVGGQPQFSDGAVVQLQVLIGDTQGVTGLVVG